jgi:hypothetical protein
MRAVFALAVLAGCHVVERSQIARPGAIASVAIHAKAVAKRPSVVLTEAGTLRFIEALECPSENVFVQQAGTEIKTKPNLATFVVGIVASSVGAISLIRGISDDDPGSSPFTYAGIGLVGVGLPFAIGPWVGNRTELVPGEVGQAVHTPGPVVPCGERAVTAKTATIKVRGVELHGTIDNEGVFSISPYMIVDAFETTTIPAWDIAVTLDGDRTKQVAAMLDGGALASRAKAFLATARFDSKIEPMRMVPGLVPGALRVTMTTTAEGAALRLALPIKNDGPGPSWALRGHVTAPGQPAIDGRVMYIGAVAKGETVDVVLSIPVSPQASEALREATIDLSIELRDAHGTAPATPVRFRGPVLVDPTR